MREIITEKLVIKKFFKDKFYLLCGAIEGQKKKIICKMRSGERGGEERVKWWLHYVVRQQLESDAD
jgi:hypothetical protein